MRLQLRDREILDYLNKVKVLCLQQVNVKFFPGKSLDSVRKRLRKLSNLKLLRQSKTTTTTSMVLTLPGVSLPKQLEHTLNINWLRLAVEKENPDFVYSCWELRGMGWQYPVEPDLVFSIGGKMYLAEIDTGSESSKQLKDKFNSYAMFDIDFVYTLVFVRTNGNSPNRSLAGRFDSVMEMDLEEIKAAIR